jgi:hypothetical protein
MPFTDNVIIYIECLKSAAAPPLSQGQNAGETRGVTKHEGEALWLTATE